MATTSKGIVSFDMLDTKTMADQGVEVPILDASGMQSGVFVTVLGADGQTLQRLSERLTRQRGKLQQKSGKSLLDVIYDTRQDEMELVAEGVVSLRHEAGEMPFAASDKDKLVEFFKKYPLVYDQVRVAQNDRALFTKASKAN